MKSSYRPLNKRQMMTAISVSLMAYAFAIAGCGQKDAPDKDTKAANAAALASIKGTWVSDTQNVKTGQQNQNFLTIDDTSVNLKTVCNIDQKDRAAAVTATAEVKNAFTVEKKTLRFADQKATGSAQAPTDCTAAIPKGNIKFEVSSDTLTLGVGSDGKVTDPKTAGMKFTKTTTDKLAQAEKDFRASSPAAKAAATTDPSAPPKTDSKSTQVSKEQASAMKLLSGIWILKAEDKVANTKLGTKITKTNYDVISFSSTDAKFDERFACQYKIPVNGADPMTQEAGVRAETTNAIDTTNLDSILGKPESNGASYEIVSGQSAYLVKSTIGERSSQVIDESVIKLEQSDYDLENCKLTYLQDAKVSFEVSKDGNSLTLTDDSNGTRVFHKFVQSTDADSLKIIGRNTKDPSKKVVTAKADAEKKPADSSNAPPPPAAAAPAVAAATGSAPTNPSATDTKAAPAADTKTAAPTTDKAPATADATSKDQASSDSSPMPPIESTMSDAEKKANDFPAVMAPGSPRDRR